ncbi:hypothetical protein VNI00_013882 [Paramarasmius palmivorus]|uniref:Uncharacterized protein n=1 Tax=Paramarasmius palmivorus TaxID=297713 RepID=A0AAW0BY06_9AGAR
MPGRNIMYKGKVTNRSWSELPPEIVRMIASRFLYASAESAYVPETWEHHHFWLHRVVYTAIRDAKTMEVLMNICPKWSAAVAYHKLWDHLVHVLDPGGVYFRHNPAVAHHPPYQHYRSIWYHTCIVCRINSPQNSKGVGLVERVINTTNLGSCGICREHRAHRAAFCGLCLREAQPYELDTTLDPAYAVFCMANEDDETWPGVDATCRSCRQEWLWKTVSNHPKEREAVGGKRFRSVDWETKTTVDCFVDLGEGSINDVINLALERYWLRKHTRLPDMMSQALAATRLIGPATDEELEELSSEIDEEDEDDMELLQMTEESGVKDLALGDWARNRILDGYWLNPADQWYNYRTFPVQAVHPCPWTIENDRDERGIREGEEEEEHPTREIVRGDIPPSYALCELAFQAHRKQMRTILLPAMKNIVRKLVIECGADGVDPAIRATKMSMEDVMKELRDEAVWFDGVDWLERRRNARRDEVQARHPREEGSDDHASTTGSSSGKSSDDSSVTSPVLSTSTLQTTPSPPPPGDRKDQPLMRRPVTIAVDPVLNPPKLLHTIPHVPVTAAHLPNYSLEAFKGVWREACQPLYHCRCSICERAMHKAQAAAAAAAGPQAQYEPGVDQKDQVRIQQPNPTQNPPQIELHEVADEVLDDDVRSDVLEYDEDEYELDDDDTKSEISQGDHGHRSVYTPLRQVERTRSRSPSPRPHVDVSSEVLRLRQRKHEISTSPKAVSPRKRSVDEMDDTSPQAQSREDRDTSYHHRGEPGTPPKRPRVLSPTLLPSPDLHDKYELQNSP